MRGGHPISVNKLGKMRGGHPSSVKSMGERGGEAILGLLRAP